MTTYVLLPRFAANRVYGVSALELTGAELTFVDRMALGGVVVAHEPTRLGGVDYLLVDCGERSLDDDQLAVVSNLSGLHALFELRPEVTVGEPALVPVALRPRALHDDDVVTIPRYVGKTNEQFTQLLINVTLAASDGAFRRLLQGQPVRLLDPVCGRGTSLSQAVVYGMDAFGVEIDRRDVDAYAQFIQTWLKDKRLPHTVDRATLRRGRTSPARRLAVSYGTERKGPRRRIEVVNDDTTGCDSHFSERSMDVVVADLPYGVQHGSRAPAAGPGAADGRAGRLTRGPEELLRTALPVWARLLRRGGALGLAWNLRTLPRDRLVELVAQAGLEPCQEPGDEGFVHRVDRSITRDVLVARRPA